MKKIVNAASIFLIGFLAMQCSGEDDNLNASSPEPKKEKAVSEFASENIGTLPTPRFYKPALDPGNVLNQTFHIGDTIVVNGIDLGDSLSLSTLDLVSNGVTVANIPLQISAPFVRGSFVVPQVPNGPYYVMLRINGIQTYANTEVFHIN